MGFELHIEEAGAVVVMRAAGRLTLTDGHTKLRDTVHVFTGQGATKFVLDMAQVQFIDSYGIGELARTYSIVRRAKGEMKLAGVDAFIAEALAVSRLNTIFEIHLTQDSAIEAFAQRAGAPSR